MLSALDGDLHFDELNKGDIVPTGAIEQWGQISRDHKFFNLVQMRCGKHIEALLRELGRPATVRCQGDMLRILTDREASPHQDRRFMHGIHKMRDAHFKAGEIDMAQLSQEERSWHIARLQVQQLKLKAVEQARG